MNVRLKCRCGSFRGLVNTGGSTSLRMICYCDDCQAYAHFLGKANDVLDANGGTDVVPVVPAHIRLSQGIENLKCLRLTEKGMYRWFAGCCKTPIGNSMPSAKVPFVGVIHTIMDHAEGGMSREEAVGPVRARVQAKFAVGTPPPDAHRTAPIGIILKTIRFLTVAWLRRQYAPSPFFDRSGRPVVEPYILTKSEREHLRRTLR